MKKPEITKGEWEYRYNGCYFDIRNSGYSFINTIQNEILEDRIGLTEDVELANARAISAIPEMIDALIDARACYQGVGDFETCGKMMSQIIPEIDKALKKAGCTE